MGWLRDERGGRESKPTATVYFTAELRWDGGCCCCAERRKRLDERSCYDESCCDGCGRRRAKGRRRWSGVVAAGLGEGCVELLWVAAAVEKEGYCCVNRGSRLMMLLLLLGTMVVWAEEQGRDRAAWCCEGLRRVKEGCDAAAWLVSVSATGCCREGRWSCCCC